MSEKTHSSSGSQMQSIDHQGNASKKPWRRPMLTYVPLQITAFGPGSEIDGDTKDPGSIL